MRRAWAAAVAAAATLAAPATATKAASRGLEVYQVDHDGADTSNNPVLLRTLRPVVAVVDNGPRKGGEPASLRALQELDGLRAVYQVHRSLRAPDANTAEERIANDAESCDAHFIKLSVDPDGRSYTVSGPRFHGRPDPARGSMDWRGP